MNHLMCEVSQNIINNWETRRDARLKQLNCDSKNPIYS